MNQARHIFRKDLHRLRWWLAAWAGLLAARVLLATAGWELTGDGHAGRFAIEQTSGVFRITTLIMFALLVARLVHDEPLVGLDWFWLTRPYDRWALLGAKLAFAVLAFVVIPLAAELVVMAAFDAGPADMLRASSVFLARDTRWTLGLMVFAVLTPTLVTFALALVGTAAGLSLLMFGVLTVLMLRFEEETPPSDAVATDATSAIVATILFVMLSLAVIGYQYHRRQRGRAMLLAAAGLAALVAVPAIWPWSFARVQPVELPAWAADPDRVAVRIDRTVPPEIFDGDSFRRSRRNRQVHLPVVLSGVPPEYRTQGAFARSRLEFPDGQVLQSGQGGGALIASSSMERLHPLHGALGDLRVVPAVEPGRRPTTPLLSVSAEDLFRYGSQPGRLTTTFIIPLHQSRAIAALPLGERASFERPGMRIEVIRVQQRHDGCTLLLRHWQVTSMLTVREPRQLDYVLRNVARGEAVVGNAQHHGFFGGHGFPLLVALTLAQPDREGFAVQHVPVEYGRRWPGQEEQLKIDAQWLDGADLVVVETAPAGVITRTTAIEDFRMQEPPADRF